MEKCARERPRDEAKCASNQESRVWNYATGASAGVRRKGAAVVRVLVLGCHGSDPDCPSGELGGGERELGPLYKGDIWA